MSTHRSIHPCHPSLYPSGGKALVPLVMFVVARADHISREKVSNGSVTKVEESRGTALTRFLCITLQYQVFKDIHEHIETNYFDLCTKVKEAFNFTQTAGK